MIHQSIIFTVTSDAGLPVTGLVANTLPAIYWSSLGTDVASQITLVNRTLNSVWTSGGVYELGQGRYRLDVPDVVYANGLAGMWGDGANVHFFGNMILDVPSMPTNLALLAALNR